MPIIKSKLRKDKLSVYSSVAAILIAGDHITAQVIYTDIDPDVNLFEEEKYYYFDLNTDGVDDVGLIENMIIATGTSYYNFEINLLNENKVAAVLDGPCTILSSSSSELCYFPAMSFPEVFLVGDIISPTLNWENLSNVVNVFSCGDYGSYGSCFFGFFDGPYGNQEQYFGFKIIGIDTSLCWLRMYWVDEHELFVTGFACVSDADELLEVDTTIISELNTQQTEDSVYLTYYNNTIQIINTSGVSGLQLNIFNVSGRLMVQSTINMVNNEIPFDAPSGIYLAEISIDQMRITKKIVVN